MGEPEDLLIRLTEEDADVIRPEEMAAAVRDTATAVGVALEWTEIGCQRHRGVKVSREVEVMHNVVSPLKLHTFGLQRPDTQSVISSMKAEVMSPDAEANLRDPIRRERGCTLCKEEGCDGADKVITAQKLSLIHI